MLVPTTTLRLELPRRSSFESRGHAEQVLALAELYGDFVLVAGDEVLAGEEIVEAHLLLGTPRIDVCECDQNAVCIERLENDGAPDLFANEFSGTWLYLDSKGSRVLR